MCARSAAALGQQPPDMMTKLTVRLQSPDIPEESFAVKPKTMYRAGNGYCRIEELPDPEQGIHGLMIITEARHDAIVRDAVAGFESRWHDPPKCYRKTVIVQGLRTAKSKLRDTGSVPTRSPDAPRCHNAPQDGCARLPGRVRSSSWQAHPDQRDSRSQPAKCPPSAARAEGSRRLQP